MKCAWQSYINILPQWLREEIDEIGKDILQELRLRVGRPPELITQFGSQYLKRTVSIHDIQFCINVASRYSPWSVDSISNGYITIEGGHRIGICGNVSVSNSGLPVLTGSTSLCIRVAKDFYGIGEAFASTEGSVLIIGPPGCGKTTLLRGIIRQKSNNGSGAVVVVDERCELFPVADDNFCFPAGLRTDILSGCGKRRGTEWVIRSMCPRWLAVDEITGMDDCEALMHAAWCGVSLLATAHAGNRLELQNRPVYRPILESGIFQNLVIMRPDKSWVMERLELCN